MEIDRIKDMIERMNRPAFQAQVAEKVEAERKQINFYAKTSHKRRRATDPIFRLRCNLRNRLKLALRSKGVKCLGRSMSLIGCDEMHLKNHLQRQFTKGMTWANMGKWHVDHILPCASFDLSDPEQQAKCFHFSNLRPLWAAENRAKRDYIHTCQPELTMVHPPNSLGKRRMRRRFLPV